MMQNNTDVIFFGVLASVQNQENGNPVHNDKKTIAKLMIQEDDL